MPATDLERFDLRGLPPLPCPKEQGEEIVVCGKRPKAMDIHTANPSAFVEKPLRPEVQLPFGTVDLKAEQRTTFDGRSAPAAIVTLKIPF